MQRFYIPNFEKQDIFILNDKDIFHQLTKVLRIRTWEKIIFFDWVENLDFVYEIIEISKKEIKLNFIEEIRKDSELHFELNLFQAMPNKLEKIEYILQKWVEIWMKKFTFYRSERSQKLVISEKKEERLKKIIVEAVEQSWRSFVPEFEISPPPSPLYPQGAPRPCKEGGENIFLHTQNNNSENLKDFIEDCSSHHWWKNITELNIFIWPEWWFSEPEIKNFEDNNFTRIHLWNRILRTETAGVVVGFTLWQLL